MDALQDMTELDSAEMRQNIDSTRSAMADKLEVLEGRVIGMVQYAQETVADSIQGAKDTVDSVKLSLNLAHQVDQRPWTIVGGCFLAGLALGYLVPKSSRSNLIPEGPVANGFIATTTPTPPLPTVPSNKTGIFDPFQEEIDKLKGLAIGYVMGLVRDSVSDSVPQLATKIDELMDGLTTKLGGEPVQHST